MEGIIILILFTYPGAVADYLHGVMIRGKQYDKPAEGYFRTARDFFLSAIITLAAMAVFCPLRGVPFTLDGAAEALRSGKGLWIFTALTLIGAAIAAGIWRAGNAVTLRARNKMRLNRNKPILDENKATWSAIMSDNDIPYQDSVMAIYKDGKLLKAGMTWIATEDPQSDPWIALTWTETAKKELEKPEKERTLLGAPQFSFVNISNGITVDIFNGKKFCGFTDAFARGEAAQAESR